MVVYLIECIVTGKKYVGKTVQTSHARWREHRTEARIGRKNTPIVQAIREFGPKNFVVTDLCTADCQKRLARRERMWIRALDTLNPEKGYNVATGGQGGMLKRRFPRDPLQASHKEKIAASMKAYWDSRRMEISRHGGNLNAKS